MMKSRSPLSPRGTFSRTIKPGILRCAQNDSLLTCHSERSEESLHLYPYHPATISPLNSSIVYNNRKSSKGTERFPVHVTSRFKSLSRVFSLTITGNQWTAGCIFRQSWWHAGRVAGH